jgi:hypothetical protein
MVALEKRAETAWGEREDERGRSEKSERGVLLYHQRIQKKVNL